MVVLSFTKKDTDPEVQVLEGRFFEAVRVIAIHKGKTTKKDVLDLLGEPWRKHGTPEREEWEYFVRYRKVPPKVLGLFSKGEAKVMYRRMVVRFEGNLVDYVFREGSTPDEVQR